MSLVIVLELGGGAGASTKRLAIALALTTLFLLAELIGAFVFNRPALLSDAAHMFTDSAALAIALAAVRIGQRAPDDQRTFGYRRFEILAARLHCRCGVGLPRRSHLHRLDPQMRKPMAEMMGNCNRMMKRMGSMADTDMKPKSQAHKTRTSAATEGCLERFSMKGRVQSPLTQDVQVSSLFRTFKARRGLELALDKPDG